MNCPHCNKYINIGRLIGSISTTAKANASRANGKLGGRKKPKKPILTKEAIEAALDAAMPKPPSSSYSPAEQAEIERNRALIAKRTSAYS